jgi:hypothetical protein
MICFKYHLNQDSVELRASDWCGLERVFVNGQMVSSKLNFGQQSEHTVALKDGDPCRFQLMLDPQTEQLICRIYKQDRLIASLKEGKEHLLRGQRSLQYGVLATSVVMLMAMYLG